MVYQIIRGAIKGFVINCNKLIRRFASAITGILLISVGQATQAGTFSAFQSTTFFDITYLRDATTTASASVMLDGDLVSIEGETTVDGNAYKPMADYEVEFVFDLLADASIQFNWSWLYYPRGYFSDSQGNKLVLLGFPQNGSDMGTAESTLNFVPEGRYTVFIEGNISRAAGTDANPIISLDIAFSFDPNDPDINRSGGPLALNNLLVRATAQGVTDQVFIPVPSTLGLLAFGVLGMATRRRAA